MGTHGIERGIVLDVDDDGWIVPDWSEVSRIQRSARAWRDRWSWWPA